MVLVDSSVWVEAARRGGDLRFKVGLEGLLGEFEAACCGVVLLEVLGGARREDRARLEHHFQCIPYLAMGDETWGEARRSEWRLRDAGQTVPWNDVVVATLALGQKWRVYARDHHFELMHDVLGLRLYEPDFGGKFRPE